FALTFTTQDVTLPNGVRLISSPGPPAVAVAADRSVVVVVGEPGGEYAAWPRPSPSPPAPPPERDSWRIESGPPQLVVEWAAPSPDDALLIAALIGAAVERRDGILRVTVDGGWPPDARRRLDAELERLASGRELGAIKEACLAWATPKTGAE